jgi:hypothetical protein
MTIGLKGNTDGSGAVQIGGSDAITISTGLNTTFAGTVTATGTVAGSTGTLYPLTSGTEIASTSGTALDFTGIPSWVKRVTVMFDSVSTNGSSNIQIQIGSGSVTTSGYLSVGNSLGAASDATAYTTGFGIRSGNATNVFHGQMTLCLLNSSAYVWTSSHAGATTTNNASYVGGGSITLSGVLDRVRITTVNGTDTFDAGSINILFE